MGRFYKTDKPTFLRDTMYTPPLDLMKSVLAVQEEGMDNALNTAAFFDDIDIKYIDSEQERQNVAKIKDYYAHKIDKLTEDLRSNPLDWQSKQREINSLKKDLSQNFATGDISKIQNSYAQKQAWMKSMEEIRKTDPHAYNKALGLANKDWGGNSYENTWSQEDIIADPNFQQYLKDAKEMLVANEIKKLNITPHKSGYLEEVESIRKGISEDRYINQALTTFLADPQNKAWMQQRQDWGMGRYFNDEGNIDLFRDKIGEDGKVVLDKKDNVVREINPTNSLSSYLSASANMANTQITDTLKYSEDTKRTNDLNRIQKENHFNRNDAFRNKKLKQDKQIADDNAEIAKTLEYLKIIDDENSSPEAKEAARLALESPHGLKANIPTGKVQNYFELKKQVDLGNIYKDYQFEAMENSIVNKLQEGFRTNSNNREYELTDKELSDIKVIMRGSKDRKDFEFKLKEYYDEGEERKTFNTWDVAKLSLFPVVTILPKFDKRTNNQKITDRKASDISRTMFGGTTGYFGIHNTNTNESFQGEYQKSVEEALHNEEFEPFTVAQSVAYKEYFKDPNIRQDYIFYAKTDKGDTFELSGNDLKDDSIISIKGMSGGNQHSSSALLMAHKDYGRIVAVPNDSGRLPEQHVMLETGLLRTGDPRSPVVKNIYNRRESQIKRLFSTLKNKEDKVYKVDVKDLKWFPEDFEFNNSSIIRNLEGYNGGSSYSIISRDNNGNIIDFEGGEDIPLHQAVKFLELQYEKDIAEKEEELKNKNN